MCFDNPSLKYVLQTDNLFTSIINLNHSLVSQIVFPCPKRRHSFKYKAKQDEIIRRHLFSHLAEDGVKY